MGRRFELTITLMLLLALAATALSGLLADYLGIPRSVYRHLSAYSLVVLASWHIVLRRALVRTRKAAFGTGGG